MIDGLILLVVLTAVPLALLFWCGGKVRKATDWGARQVMSVCRRSAVAAAAPASDPAPPAAKSDASAAAAPAAK